MDFIQAQQNITDKTSLDWHHFANLSKVQIQERWTSPEGKGLLNSLKSQRFSRESLSQNIGQFNGQYDLRGAPLADMDLSGTDLSSIDFFAADLSRANLSQCNLAGSYLSESQIKGTCFDWAKLDDALLDNAEFDASTHFYGVDLHRINFTFATLLYDLALSQHRIQQLKQQYPYLAVFLRISCDYGRSFGLYLFWVVLFLLLYAVLYKVFMHQPFVDCLYFSIATFATVGYGELAPESVFEKILVMSEIGIGYLMGGLLVGILAKRVIG